MIQRFNGQKSMKQRIGQLALATMASLVGAGLVALPQGIVPEAMAKHPSGPPSHRPTVTPFAPSLTTSSTTPSVYLSQAPVLIQGVVAPLNYLRLMKRAVAKAGDDDSLANLPLLAILNEPMKTTGLGPIQIGMTLEDLEAAGLTPIPLEGSGDGVCQYYRIKGNSEPLGLMAIDGRVLRIDVWPGSLIETRSGAKIGSTETDLIRIYGNRLEAIANPVTLGKTIVFTPRNPGEDLFRLVFETDDRGRVVQYRAGQFPSVTWAGGCL